MTRNTEPSAVPDPLAFSPDELRELKAQQQREEAAKAAAPSPPTGAEQHAAAAASRKPPGVSDYVWTHAMSADERQAAGAAAKAGPSQTAGEDDDDIDGTRQQAEAAAMAGAMPATPAAGKASGRKPFAAAVAAAALEVEVRNWLKRQRKAKDFSAAAVAPLARQRGEAFAAEVARQLGPDAKAKTFRGIVAENKRQLRQALKDAGIKPVAIPRRDERMRSAIAELVRHVDAGQKPAARAAAQRQGLDLAQAKKLAYSVRVTREAVDAGLCLLPRSSFVVRLRQDPAWRATVVAPHASLSALARVMANAQQALTNRPGAAAAGRGAWHGMATELRAAGRTVNEIAHMIGRKPDTVKKFLGRRGLLGGTGSADDAVED